MAPDLRWPPSKALLKRLVEEAILDAYGDAEQRTGFLCALGDHLDLPFEPSVLGVTVAVEKVDVTEAGETFRRGVRSLSPQADVGSPGSRARCFRACSGSRTARGPCASRDSDAHGVRLPPVSTASAPRSCPQISRLDTRPAPSPVNASPLPSLTTAHDSGPVWLATPSPYETSIRCNLAGFAGARTPRSTPDSQPGQFVPLPN